MTKVNSITFDLTSRFMSILSAIRFVEHLLSDIFRERSIKLIVILYVNSGKEEQKKLNQREREREKEKPRREYMQSNNV